MKRDAKTHRPTKPITYDDRKIHIVFPSNFHKKKQKKVQVAHNPYGSCKEHLPAVFGDVHVGKY